MSQLTISFFSRKMGTRVPVRVMLPEPAADEPPEKFYSSGARFRVLWLMHGGTENSEDFYYKYHIHKLFRGKKIIAVMPTGLNSDFANYTNFGSGFPFIDFFFDELMPYVYSVFPASRDPRDNYLAGYSMGGSAVSMLGFKHPELFQGGIAPLGSALRTSDYLEPYLDMTSSEFRALAESDPLRFPTGFGKPGIKPKEINLICHFATVRDFAESDECTWNRFPEAVKSGKLPELYFCCGELDSITLEADKKLMEYAKKLGFENISFDVMPGLNHPAGIIPAFKKMIEKFGL